MERTLLFGEKGRIREKGDRDAGFLRRVTALGEGRPDPALRPGGQGTAGEKEAGKNPEEAGSRAPCRADTVRESGTERKIPGDLLLTESCENIKIKS